MTGILETDVNTVSGKCNTFANVDTIKSPASPEK